MADVVRQQFFSRDGVWIEVPPPAGSGSVGPVGATGPTGPFGPPGPNAVSADGGNTAFLGTDSLIFVPLSSGGGGVPVEEVAIGTVPPTDPAFDIWIDPTGVQASGAVYEPLGTLIAEVVARLAVVEGELAALRDARGS